MKKRDIYTLVHLHFSGEASKNEQAALEEWLDASAQNRRLFAEFEKIWQHAEPEKPYYTPDISQKWLELENRIDVSRPKSNAPMLPMHTARRSAWKRSGWRQAVAVAVALVMLLGGALLYRNWQAAHQLLELRTQNADRRQLTLSDGTIVHLNSASKLTYPQKFSGSSRVVSIRGEAFFEVKPSETPFVVNTETARIQVLGTSFNIWARNEETRVAVQDGRVSLGTPNLPPDSGVVLTANQMSICRKNSVPQTPVTVNVQKLIGWMHNRIVFERMPLAEIVAELERFYDVDIELKSRALEDSSLTGTFYDKPLDTVLTSICMTLNLDCTRSKDKYIISP